MVSGSLNMRKSVFSLLLVFGLCVVAVLPAYATVYSGPLNGAYWLMPVPADQSTGRITQTEISNGVSGYIPGDCYGAYPTLTRDNPYFNLSATPYLSMDIYASECSQLYIIIVDQSNGGWTGFQWDITDLYGHGIQLGDSSPMRVANSATPQHFEVDMRQAGLPLDNIGRISVNVVPGMKGIPCNYTVTNIAVSASSSGSGLVASSSDASTSKSLVNNNWFVTAVIIFVIGFVVLFGLYTERRHFMQQPEDVTVY